MAFKGISVKLTANEAIATGGTVVPWDAVHWSKGGTNGWWGAGDPTKIKPSADVTLLRFFVRGRSDAGPENTVELRKNGALAKGGMIERGRDSKQWCMITAPIQHSSGDEYTLWMRDQSGAFNLSFDILNTEFGCYAMNTLPVYSGARMTRTLATSQSGGITYQTEDWDIGGWVDLDTQNKRFTVPAGAEVVEIVSHVSAGAGGFGFRVPECKKNGAAHRAADHRQVNDSTTTTGLAFVDTVVAGDYYEFFYDSTNNNSIANATWASIRKLA